MHKMAYCTEFAKYSWGYSSPIINCTYSKCGFWECSNVGMTEKESKHFVHCHIHFLTHPRTHHTHFLSYRFWFAGYRFSRLEVVIVFELYLKYAQIYVSKSDCGVCLRLWCTSRRSHPPPDQKRNIFNSTGFVWYVEHFYPPNSFWVTHNGEERRKKDDEEQN